jgi:hypothetical protein
MPAKFRIKEYKPGAIYYIYSTAVGGRNVFEDEVDYSYWMTLLERYCGGILNKGDARYKSDRPYRMKLKMKMVLVGEVKVLVYCFMRQNIHLIIWQKNRDGITKLMRRLMTNYTMYINRRHRKKGKLFSGVYKGVMVPRGEKLVYLSRWIHLLPRSKSVRRFGLVESVTETTPEEYLYSSYGKFIKGDKNEWFDPEMILAEFEKLPSRTRESYKQFVESNPVEKKVEEQIGDLIY